MSALLPSEVIWVIPNPGWLQLINIRPGRQALVDRKTVDLRFNGDYPKSPIGNFL
jgi:hypothetical protein